MGGINLEVHVNVILSPTGARACARVCVCVCVFQFS